MLVLPPPESKLHPERNYTSSVVKLQHFRDGHGRHLRYGNSIQRWRAKNTKQPEHQNLVVGTGAGAALDTSQAFDNIFVGFSAGRATTKGDNNLFFGNNAGLLMCLDQGTCT
jgi:hypothetical protein